MIGIRVFGVLCVLCWVLLILSATIGRKDITPKVENDLE